MAFAFFAIISFYWIFYIRYLGETTGMTWLGLRVLNFDGQPPTGLGRTDGPGRQTAVFRGDTQKVVVLSFFASWCKPCQKEAPVLADIASSYEGQDVQLFFVNWGDTDNVAAEWLQTYGVEANCLMDPFGANAKKFGVNSLPRTIIIDQQGFVQLIERGFSEENEAHYRELVTSKVNELLNPGD